MAWSLLMKRSHSRFFINPKLSKLPWHSHTRPQFRLSHSLSTPTSIRRKGTLGALAQNMCRPVRGMRSNLYPKTFLIPTRYCSGNKGTPNITTSINTAAANIVGRPELVKDLEKADQIIPHTKPIASNVINPVLMEAGEEELVYFQPSQGSYIDSTTFEPTTQPTIYQLNKVEDSDYAFTLQRPGIPLDLAVRSDGQVSFEFTGDNFKITQTSTSDNLYKFTLSFDDDGEERFLYMAVDDSVDPTTTKLAGTTTDTEQATEFILRRAESPRYSVLTYELDLDGQTETEKSANTVLIDRQYIGTLTDDTTDTPLIYTTDVVTPWTFTSTGTQSVDHIFTINPLLRVNQTTGKVVESKLLRDAQNWDNQALPDVDLTSTKLRTRVETIITDQFENRKKSWFSLRMYHKDVTIPMTATLFNENNGDQLDIEGEWSGRVYFDPKVTDHILRLNCGGGNYTDKSGVFWADDKDYVSTELIDFTYTSQTGMIGNVADGSIYLSERYAEDADLNYIIPVGNGSYTVKLYFAEIYFDASGERVFQVKVQNVEAGDPVDIYSEVGGFMALVLRYRNISVRDGQLSISILKDVQNPKISAIEIERVEDTDDSVPDEIKEIVLGNSGFN